MTDDSSPTVSEFEEAVIGWAATQSTDGPLYIYLIDHGATDAFKIFPNEILYADQFRRYLDAFQNATSRRVVVMIEACKSGSFTDDLAGKSNDRVIVTSTGIQDGYMNLDGTVSFTQLFISRLLTGDSVYQAWLNTKEKLSEMGIPYSNMQPQLVEGIPVFRSLKRLI